MKPLKRGFPRAINVLVFDVETLSATTGKPYFLSMFDGISEPVLKPVTQGTILEEVIEYLEQRCSKRSYNVMFAHNLSFDITALVSQKENEIFEQRYPPLIDHPHAEIRIMCEKTWYAKIRLKKNNARILILDSANFIKGSLERISHELHFKNQKPERPWFVKHGRAPRNKDEWYRLRSYVRGEIKAEHELAELVTEMHRGYNVSISVSASQLASRVFAKNYITRTIPQAPGYIRWLAEQTIHGGRSGAFVSMPQAFPNVNMYDYNSFYSWAMTRLPPITSGRWEQVEDFVEDAEGFYRISGHVKRCRYPIVIKSTSAFEYANDEHVQGIPITSYELREALATEELIPSSVKGWVWRPTTEAENPFQGYVEEFYRKKSETSKDDPLYITYKLLLNCLYGKTYQAIRADGYEEEPDLLWRNGRVIRNRIQYRAGGLYLPHVGSWITSMCRAKLHADLHLHEGIDCATDSFKTLRDVPTGNELGALKLVTKGLLLLIRPKLYVMLSPKIQEEVIQTGDLREYLRRNLDALTYSEDGKGDITKFALHGYWGTCQQLLQLYVEKGNEYVVEHMTKIRESILRGKAARVMETQGRSLHIDWEEEKGFCGLRKKIAIKTYELCTLQCFQCPSGFCSMGETYGIH